MSRIQDVAHRLTPQDKETFNTIVERCLKQVHQLGGILQKLTISKDDSAFRKGFKVAIGMAEESRIQRIATALKDNVQILTCLNTAPAEKEKPAADERRTSEAPPLYGDSTGVFSVPFIRDSHFVGRDNILLSITEAFGNQNRVAVAGIGGVGKSQVAIEYCYQFKEANPDAHVFWVYGGNIPRFYQGYKRIAQTLALPSWDDPETSILDLVSSWFATTSTTFLMVLDNADNIMHYWPGKYKLADSAVDPATDLSAYLPESKKDHLLLITTRDTRVAGRLAKEGRPIALQNMSKEEATQLFLSKVDGDPHEYDQEHIDGLLNELDYLPLAISQAAAFIEENGISISEYLEALGGDDAEEFLHEELNDSRRDEQSINSVFRTWKMSFDLISQQKARAAELLCLLAMLDRQSIPRSLLKVPEVVTSLGTLQAFNLITARVGSQSFGMHRLVQRFVQLSVKRSGIAQKWKDQALACVSKAYPTEIGVAEWPLCDTLAPHVQIVSRYEYTSTAARLDLAHLLCWAADFDIERGMCEQALRCAHQSLIIFRELVPEMDERLAAATWLYGRLQYYEAKSEDDINAAAETLKRALQISKHPSLNYAESAFELAHLYYDHRNETESLKMGKASFECWKAMEGLSSMRTLDNMEDYAVELAMFGRKEEAIAYWQKIIDLCPGSDASENTKNIYTYRSMASIAEFQGDASMAEIFYTKLITLGEAIYNPEHVHVLEYRICHAEQVMRQGRLKEAIQLGQAILATCKNSSGWQIIASCFQLIAECNRVQCNFNEAEVYHLKLLELLTNMLGRGHQETVDALEACATCFMSNSQPQKAEPLYKEIVNWREAYLDPVHADTIRVLEWYGICLAHQARDTEAEAKFLEIISRQAEVSPHVLENLCASLWNQGKWGALESRCRQALEIEGYDHASAQSGLIVALEQQGKMEEALELRTKFLSYTVIYTPFQLLIFIFAVPRQQLIINGWSAPPLVAAQRLKILCSQIIVVPSKMAGEPNSEIEMLVSHSGANESHKALGTGTYKKGNSEYLSGDVWLWEITGCVVGIVGVVLIYVTLYHYDGKERPQLPFNTTLSPLLSVLATIISTAVSVPLSSGISQIIWLKLRRGSRPLTDIELFQNASKGIVGGLGLIIRGRGGYREFLGVVACLLVFAIGPCTQAALNYKELSGKASIQRCFDGEPWVTVYTALHGALVLDDWNHTSAQDQFLQELNKDCTTGDCDWPTPVSTLAFCSECANITSSISKSCVGNVSDVYGDPCTFSLPNGLSIQNNETSVTWLNTTSILNFNESKEAGRTNAFTINYQNWDDSYIAFLAILGYTTGFSVQGSDYVVRRNPQDPEAVECIVYWCVQGYNTTIKNSTLSQNLTTSWHQGTKPTNYSADNQLVFSPPESEWSSLGLTKPTNFTASSEITNSFGVWITAAFSGSITEPVNNEAPDYILVSFWDVEIDTFPQLLTYAFSSMTNSLRAQCPTNTSAIGIANNVKSVVDVRWAWLAQLAATVVLASVFLALVIWGSGREGVDAWKGSTLALLFHGRNIGGVAEMKERGKRVHASLVPGDEGNRLDFKI
ncbi:hypothetical protein G7Y89_g10407 [Cudoniella acicularis]|uniref:Uncharacterized protein n=1 Tax=Cudoniella acicularis TaxID=354080 RepID=A0A8H4VZ86_9HELO|nr:hypothetical protein G7Y89_g10407 [Cudoniella acicularis]